MKIKELFEDQTQNLAVILPGRFQPPHPGHLHAYLQLVNKFGADNVYITMSNKTNPENSPFLYDERKQILIKLLGVPSDKIVQVTKQFNVENAVKSISLSPNTAIIFAVCRKDATKRKLADKIKNSDPESYMKKYKKSEPLDSYEDHAYIIEYPATEFEIHGEKINSASQIRNLFRNLNVQQKKKLFKSIYGHFDDAIFYMFIEKLAIN